MVNKILFLQHIERFTFTEKGSLIKYYKTSYLSSRACVPLIANQISFDPWKKKIKCLPSNQLTNIRALGREVRSMTLLRLHLLFLCVSLAAGGPVSCKVMRGVSLRLSHTPSFTFFTLRAYSVFVQHLCKAQYTYNIQNKLKQSAPIEEWKFYFLPFQEIMTDHPTNQPHEDMKGH